MKKNLFENESELMSRINASPCATSEAGLRPVGFTPDHLTLQWHITDRCNLKCSHCYINNRPLPELNVEKLGSMLQAYVETLKRMKIKGRIHLTGGEPFVRGDIFDFLELIASYSQHCSFGILCNGTMISEKTAAGLKKSGCSFVQVSLDGGAEVHDSIRGDGAFSETISAIGLLRKFQIPVSVSFTAGKNNYMEFGSAADAAVKAGAVSVWSDRIIPERGREPVSSVMMNDREVENYFKLMNRSRKVIERKYSGCSGVSMGRALQFMFYNGKGFDGYPYRCTAGSTVLTVLPDGMVVPCRRMPVIIGDLKKDELYDIYMNSPLLNMLRNPLNVPSGCGGCRYSQICNGGLKCLSYAVYGTPFNRDPQCTAALMKKSINKL